MPVITNDDSKKKMVINVKPPMTENIPKELKDIPQWVAWKAVPGKNGKTDKIPYDPNTKGMGKANNPDTWGKFDAAYKFYTENADKLAGVGIELLEKNDLIGVDLDDCFDDTGKLQDWAQAIIAQLNTYTEVSPSGRGIRMFVFGALPKNGRKKGTFEWYNSGRFLTVTGHIVEGSPLTVEDRKKEIIDIHNEMFKEEEPKNKTVPEAAGILLIDDNNLINKAINSKSGTNFSRLWSGSWGGYSSQSEGDQALCNYLAFWTCLDAGRMDRLFRQSGLYREKWDKKHYADGQTYGQGTIEKAIASTDKVYWPPKKRKSEPNKGLTHTALKSGFNFTDLGNARRFVERHGKDIKYIFAEMKWLYWDSKRWNYDDTGEIWRKAKETVGAIYEEASAMPDDNLRKSIAKHGMRSEAENRINAMISLARSEPGIPITLKQLDQDNFLLNCNNGTIDLKTGELLNHNRDHLITKISPVNYDPAAGAELFQDFLDRIIPSNDLQVFIKKSLGYALTGDIGEEKLWFPYGPPATGKSTLLSAVISTLGDYAATADFETFLAQDRGNKGPRNDVARLAGRRFVVSLEVEDGKKLAESLINQLTGGDVVTARFLYKESFEFTPTFKLWLCANNRPKISGTDGAIWRRILQVPFNQQIPVEERDPNLKTKFKDPEVGAGILNWLVKGCLAYMQEGLHIPDEVAVTTEEYKQEQDPLNDFIEECCLVGENNQVDNPSLWGEYQEWCRKNGERHPIGRKKFAQVLESKGLDQYRKAKKRVWSGIGLLAENEELF